MFRGNTPAGWVNTIGPAMPGAVEFRTQRSIRMVGSVLDHIHGDLVDRNIDKLGPRGQDREGLVGVGEPTRMICSDHHRSR